MSILSLLAFFAFIVYLYLSSYTYRLDPKSRLNRQFSYLCLTFAVWAFAYTFFYSAPDRETAWFWYRISSVGWCFFPGLTLHYFLILTEKEKILKRGWTYLVLYLPGLVFLYKALNDVLLVKDFIYKGLGWCEIASSGSVWFWSYPIYYMSFILSGLFLTLKWGNKAGVLRRKKQARVIAITALPVLVSTAITDSILPALNIQVIPSVASISILFWVFGIWYSITRYRLMALTPSIAADEIISKMVDLLVLVDPKGHILKVNYQAGNLLGYGEKELIGRPLSAIIADEAFVRNEIMGAKGDVHNPYASELTCKTKGGEGIPVNISFSVIKDRDGECVGIVVIGQDIRQMKQLQREIAFRKRMEEELLKVEKLESLGVLAGGLAHDFNNLLTGIMGNISLAKMFANPDDKVYQKLTEAEKASLRAKDLTQQLLTYSKGGAPVKRTVSMEQILRDSTGFALRGSNVRCDLVLEDNMSAVEVDEGQMSQVINNIIINANQAMAEGGVMRVSCRHTTIGHEDVPSLKGGTYVKVSIEDQGIGIPKEHLPRIFDPYFTTKQKGSGLGLATAFSIVKRHDGHLTVESTPGVGTTFHIYLPASSGEIQENVDRGDGILAGKGKILVMDDEETVRTVAGEILGHLGYCIEFAREGEEAIDIYKGAKGSGEPFDVVIMDLTIPGGMGGKEAIKKLLEIDPEVRAIVSSGYSNDPIMADFTAYGFKGVITKPYRVRELSEAVHKVIAMPQE